MYNKFKYRTYLLLNPAKGNEKWDKLVDYFLVTLISLNIVAVILETVDDVYNSYNLCFKVFEKFSVYIFTVEYLLRLWACTCETKYKHPTIGRLKWIFSFGALIDLLAFLPFYLPFTKVDLRVVRILRLFRFLRVFKLGRYLNATKLISNVFKSKKEELILCLVITLSLIILASSFMYFAENQAQPDKYSSIPATMWWCVTTLTTVGYGDVFPITVIGKILTAFIAILGIGMFALPAGILASGFSDEFRKRKNKEKHICPHCGKEINNERI
ncbi:MAG: ion transporter [Prevotellaceae bacterium]|jgi:voltage-gated potassium channel|nr:ion transporter [Prevotellaceae bacterium]